MIRIIKDLRLSFGNPRDQGSRPTCAAFAASDLHAFNRGNSKELSVEYLYYHACQRDIPPKPEDGATVKSLREAAEIDGQPVEADWPYLVMLPICLANWIPPENVDVFSIKMSTSLNSPSQIIRLLDADKPTLAVIRLTKKFFQPTAEGIVEDVVSDSKAGMHAVVAVGHGSDGTNRLILVRNSWGRSWGLDGYAWLYEDYLTRQLQSSLNL